MNQQRFLHLTKRFAGPVIAAYLLHWGVWWLIFVVTQGVMVVLTNTLDWIASGVFGSFQLVERESMPGLLAIPEELLGGVIPLIFGLLVGWWILRHRANAPSL